MSYRMPSAFASQSQLHEAMNNQKIAPALWTDQQLESALVIIDNNNLRGSADAVREEHRRRAARRDAEQRMAGGVGGAGQPVAQMVGPPNVVSHVHGNAVTAASMATPATAAAAQSPEFLSFLEQANRRS